MLYFIFYLFILFYFIFFFFFKNQILAHKIFLNICFSTGFGLQVTCITHIIRKTLTLLNLTGNEIFMKIRKIAFSVKLPRGLEIALEINSGQKDVPFITIIGKSVFFGTS